MDALLALPSTSTSSNSISEISPHSLGFLNKHFKSQKDLSRAQSLSTELKKECGDLDRSLIILRNNLSSLISSWISRSNCIRRLLHHLNFKIQRFGLYTSQDGMEKTNLRKIPKILDQDLLLLAKEVRRIEMVRSYAENPRATLVISMDSTQNPASKIEEKTLVREIGETPNPVSEIGETPVCEIEEIEDEIDIAFKNFKRFDVVVSSSFGHWFYNSISYTTRKQKTIEKIQEEWKDLEENLPATIYVRAYKGRIDLMRAALIGSRGTPYHNGLFFIDIQFPSNYPSDAPKLYFHGHGPGLNPNIRSGEICFGHGKILEEIWDPDSWSILRVLVSIQELVLNEKPYFNQPGYEYKGGFSSQELEKALEYNKQVFMLSCKAMLKTLRDPMRHFEYLVLGHFRKNSHKILMDCKWCLDGDENMDGNIFMELMKAFERNGSYCKHFLGYTKELKDRKLKPETKKGWSQVSSFFSKIGFN